jgi:hypothetical protein
MLPRDDTIIVGAVRAAIARMDVRRQAPRQRSR